MKKLVYITTNLQDSGGISRILSFKLNYLIEAYHYDILVINSNQSSDDYFFDFDSRITLCAIKSKSILNYKKQVNHYIEKFKPDIIINCDNGLKGSLLPYFIAPKKPVIYERHCSKNIKGATLLENIKLIASNFFLQINSDFYKYFIVLNEAEKQDWNNRNIKVIPNPLWLKTPKLKDEDDSKIVIAVGRHSYEKRYDRLIDIWEIVAKQHPEWILKIYGEKNESLLLKKRVLEKKLEENIKFYNPIKDISKIFSEASMLLSTSQSESFGLVLLEAMAFGMPVIAFDETSGAKTIIKNDENGFLVLKNDLNGFIEKVNFLITNKKVRNEMGLKAQKSIELYQPEKIMSVWHNLFMTLH